MAQHHALTIALILLAMLFYALGLSAPRVGAIMLAGMACELWFWVRWLRHR